MTSRLLSRFPRSILQSTKGRSFTSLPCAAGTSSNGNFHIQRESTNKRKYTTYSQLPEEHQMIYEMCRKFADEELAPNAGEWDQKHEFPADAVAKLVRKAIKKRPFCSGKSCCVL